MMILRRVDLPAPLVPMMPTVSPFFTSMVMPSSARKALLYFFPVMLNTSRTRSRGLSYSLYSFFRSLILIIVSLFIAGPSYSTSAKCIFILRNTFLPASRKIRATAQ